MATISLHHVKACLAGYEALRSDRDVLLARAGINPSVINQAYGRVHTDRVARLFKLIQQELDDEFMGFTRKPLKYGIFTTLFELVSHCNTLGELLQKGIRFLSLVTDDVRLALRTEGKTTSLNLSLAEPHLDPSYFITEYLMVIWHRAPSWFIGESIRLHETHFHHPAPEHRSELKIMFPGLNRFGQGANRLLFDTAYLGKPLIRTQRELQHFMRNAPADVMTIPGEDNSLEAQIERAIIRRSSEQLDFPDARELAAIMQTSPQTLYRRLRQEGSSYIRIKDNMRREISIDKLINEKLSVEEVSDIVGFAEPRSFTRAFKGWTGLSPRNYCKFYRNAPDRGGAAGELDVT